LLTQGHTLWIPSRRFGVTVGKRMPALQALELILVDGEPRIVMHARRDWRSCYTYPEINPTAMYVGWYSKPGPDPKDSSLVPLGLYRMTWLVL
jgi:hypothetical protein